MKLPILPLIPSLISTKTWTASSSTQAAWTILYDSKTGLFHWNATLSDNLELYLFFTKDASTDKADNIRLRSLYSGYLEDYYGTYTSNYKDSLQRPVNKEIVKPTDAGGKWQFVWDLASKAEDVRDVDLPCDDNQYTYSWYNKDTQEMGQWMWRAATNCTIVEDPVKS